MTKKMKTGTPLAPGWLLATKVDMVGLTGALGKELLNSTKADMDARVQEFQNRLRLRNEVLPEGLLPKAEPQGLPDIVADLSQDEKATLQHRTLNID